MIRPRSPDARRGRGPDLRHKVGASGFNVPLVVQWIEHELPELGMRVRILPRGLLNLD